MIDLLDDQLSEILKSLGSGLHWPSFSVRSRPQGNKDRKECLSRQHVIVDFSDGESKFITLGSDLKKLADAHKTLHQTYPSITSVPGNLYSINGTDVYVQKSVIGGSFESLLHSFNDLPQALLAWEEIQTAFAEATKSSNRDKIEKEWDLWSNRFSTLPFWSNSERSQLTAQILPAIRADLVTKNDSPTVRVSNGDLTTSNILVDPSGQPTLIDPEHSAETHFHFEEHLRFVRLSPALIQHPGLAQYFHSNARKSEIQFHFLKRLWFEYTENSQSYCDRVIPFLKRCIWNGPGSEESAVHEAEIETAQLFFDDHSNWSETASVRIPYVRGKPQLMVFPICSASRFRFDPSSSRIPLRVNSLKIVENSVNPSTYSPALDFKNTTVSNHQGVHSLTPHNTDPQIHFQIEREEKSRWVIVELESDKAED